MGSASAADDRLSTPRPLSMAPLCTPGNPISSSRRPPRGVRGASSDSSGGQDARWCLAPAASQPISAACSIAAWCHRSTPVSVTGLTPCHTPDQGVALPSPGPAPRPAPHPCTGSGSSRAAEWVARRCRARSPPGSWTRRIASLRDGAVLQNPRRLCVPTPVTQPAQHATDPKPALTRFFESK